MAHERADLAAYSPWGAYPIPPPVPPDPAWLPVTPAAGSQTFADLIVWALSQNVVLGRVTLYSNFLTPTSASVLADFTPITAAGLGPQLLGAATPGLIDHCGRALWTWPNIVFTAAGGGLPVQAWGYFVSCTDPITGMTALLWAQRLVTPFAFLAAGNALPVPLTLTLGPCGPCR